MATVDLIDVSKVYPDGHIAVRHVDLAISDGELHVLVGPSGCGKTTVLRMVAGLERATGGDIHIDGRRVNDVSAQERNVAMAFQQHALYPHMTVAENLGFPLKMGGWHADDTDARVREVARLLHIADVLERTPRRLSGGQQQRVSLGRTIIRNPRLFLMDEPLSNLDTRLRIESRAEIIRVHRSLGATTIFVTHDQAEAMAMADRLTIMRDGVVVQSGSPADVYAEPVDLFTAQFMGSPQMNVVLGTVDRVAASGDVIVGIGAHEISLDRTALDARSETAVAWPALVGREVGVGVRPEALHRDPAGDVVTSVVSTMSLGANQLVHANIDAPSVSTTADGISIGETRSSVITVFVDDQHEIGLWEPFRLRVDSEAVHLFDLSTGSAL